MSVKSTERRLRAEEIGRNNEARVLEIALELRSEGIYPFDPDMPQPYLTTPNSAEDCEGIDLWVPTVKGYVGIQIKSSAQFAEAFRTNHKNGKLIPVVLANRPKHTIRLELISAVKWVMETWFPEEKEA